MNKRKLISILLLGLLGAALFVTPVLAQTGESCSENVLGGACRLRSGEKLDNLTILGGAVTLDEGSLVRGDVALAGGALVVAGEVKGDIHAMGGTVNLTETAHVYGDVSTFGASLRQSDKARVDGRVNIQSPEGVTKKFTLPSILALPEAPKVPAAPQPVAGELLGRFDLLDTAVKFFWWVFRTLAVSALALLLMLFLPLPVRRVAQTMSARPAMAGGMGCLTILVVVTASFFLVVTILLSPVGLLALLLLMVAALFGWMALGYEVGQRLARMANVSWAEPVSAAVGTLLLTLVAGAAEWIPCIGWLVPAAVVLLGVGGVAISRFGARGVGDDRESNKTGPAAPIPPASPISSAVVPVVPLSGFPNDMAEVNLQEQAESDNRDNPTPLVPDKPETPGGTEPAGDER